jgi:hypothetical protein
MPSQQHEILIELFRNQPRLAPTLLQDVLGLTLPEFTDVRTASSELTDVVPTEFRADMVVLLVHGATVLGIVIEVQLRKDANKRESWPVYLATLRAREKCPCCLLVIAPSERVAKWASRRIELGPGSSVQPLVIGPRGVPQITDVALARRQPELAILSVLAHGKSSKGTAIGTAAFASLRDLDELQAALYHDIIEANLSAEAKKELIRMAILNYRFQGPSFRRGKAEGKAEGKAHMLTWLMARKFGELDQPTSERIERAAVKDVERWAERVLTAASIDEVFDE